MLVGDGQFFPEGGHYSLVNYVLGGGQFSLRGGHYSLVNFVLGGQNSLVNNVRGDKNH